MNPGCEHRSFTSASGKGALAKVKHGPGAPSSWIVISCFARNARPAATSASSTAVGGVTGSICELFFDFFCRGTSQSSSDSAFRAAFRAAFLAAFASASALPVSAFRAASEAPDVIAGKLHVPIRFCGKTLDRRTYLE